MEGYPEETQKPHRDELESREKSLDEDQKTQAKCAKSQNTSEHGSTDIPRILPSNPASTYPWSKSKQNFTMTTSQAKMASTSKPPMLAEEEGLGDEMVGGTEETKMAGHLQEQVDDEPLPWHAEQLYKLYGPKADYFLKPKLEDKQRKKSVTIIDPIQMKQRGRAGAGHLWTSLRNESQQKLLEQDMQISPDLKAAYSAFVRQCLANRKKPVKRNFSTQEDVPEMDRLMDQSKVLAAHDYKHMVEVMYRASVTNHDKTGILRHNNPPPNLNNWRGEESCARYMPSWIPTYDEEEDMAVHAKWLSLKKQKEVAEGTSVCEDQHTPRSEEGQGDGAQLPQQMAAMSVSTCTNNEWEFLKDLRRKRPKPKTQKYVFLTEKAATCAGEFSKKHKEKLDSQHIPKAYEKGQVKAQSALAMVDDNSSQPSLSVRSMPRTNSRVSQRLVSSWQPLSLNALIEYKEKIAVLGNGDFSYGTTPRWSVEKAY